MKAPLWHYTINSNDMFDCSQKDYSAESMEVVALIAQRAVQRGKSSAFLPEPFDRFTVTTTSGSSFAVFDIYSHTKAKGKQICTCNAVCWKKESEQDIWEPFEELYLNLMKEFNFKAVAPHKPENLPWLTTMVLPNPSGMVGWIADFEQVYAYAVMKATHEYEYRLSGGD